MQEDYLSHYAMLLLHALPNRTIQLLLQGGAGAGPPALTSPHELSCPSYWDPVEWGRGSGKSPDDTELGWNRTVSLGKKS